MKDTATVPTPTAVIMFFGSRLPRTPLIVAPSRGTTGMSQRVLNESIFTFSEGTTKTQGHKGRADCDQRVLFLSSLSFFVSLCLCPVIRLRNSEMYLALTTSINYSDPHSAIRDCETLQSPAPDPPPLLRQRQPKRRKRRFVH